MAPRAPLYPGNSDSGKSKTTTDSGDNTSRVVNAVRAPAEEEKPEEKKPLEGTVVKRKKTLADSFASVFFGEQAKKVGEYLLFDVFIPTAKDVIVTMITSGTEMAIYGETRRGRNSVLGSRDRDRTTIRYDMMHERERPPYDRREERRLRSRYNFDDILFSSRADAEYVLNVLDDAVGQYGEVTVAEFFSTAGLPRTYADEKYGWKNLSGSGVAGVRGGWILELPKPMVLDD